MCVCVCVCVCVYVCVCVCVCVLNTSGRPNQRFEHNLTMYEGGSICNENPFITPSTNAFGFYAICQTKDQSFAFIMVQETLFYLSNLTSYRLFKKHTNIHCIYFPLNCKDSFKQR